MSKRKLAVITARADDRVQKDIICGISEAAFSVNCDVAVFSNIYNYWQDDIFLTFENIIYSFFNPDGFDGVIITAEAFMDISIISDVIDKIRKSDLPAAVINGEIDGFKSFYCNDENDMERICTHLISVHNITDIDILTGQKNNMFSERRLSGGGNESTHGFRYTEDGGENWINVTNSPVDGKVAYGGPGGVSFVHGDFNVYGRVYLSSEGFGVICWDLADKS